MAMTIFKSVGQNCYDQKPADVKLVQTALNACRCPRFFAGLDRANVRDGPSALPQPFGFRFGVCWSTG